VLGLSRIEDNQRLQIRADADRLLDSIGAAVP
jgi:hypothetical protein